MFLLISLSHLYILDSIDIINTYSRKISVKILVKRALQMIFEPPFLWSSFQKFFSKSQIFPGMVCAGTDTTDTCQVQYVHAENMQKRGQNNS